MRNVILGIDTGGTYTDGVIMDYETKKVIRGAKAFTTKENLSVGIIKCIEQLALKEEIVCKVALSTTLATNSIVEGRGALAGLITIGSDQVYQAGKRKYPVKIVRHICGEIDILGRELEPVKKDEIKTVLQELDGKIEALAVSGFASVKNPMQELLVKRYAEELLRVPVVCAHELSTELGFYERTVTAALNAKLIPLIHQLLDDVKKAMIEEEINAPITIIKGDGYAMNSEYAKSCPVETILSGPAASAVGGTVLSGLEDAIIVDMGGTTTDIICVDNGEAAIENEGMLIEGWRTRVRSVKAHTYGLGGDSMMRISREGKITFGPEKAKPICTAAWEFPYLRDELAQRKLPDGYMIENRNEAEGLYLLRNLSQKQKKLSQRARQVIKLLEKGPHTLTYLAEELNTDIDSLAVEELITSNLVQLISLTPTDLLHAAGEFTQWDAKASLLAAELLAARLHVSSQEFLGSASSVFIKTLCEDIMSAVCAVDNPQLLQVDAKVHKLFINVFFKRENKHLEAEYRLKQPIVGIGAPANAWLRKAARQMGAEYFISEHSPIAGAVGAAAGKVKEGIEACICRDFLLDNYVSFLPERRSVFDNLESAEKAAEEAIRAEAERLISTIGVRKGRVDVSKRPHYMENVCTGESIFLRMELTAVISGEL